MINTLSKLLGNSPKSISNWKKENRPIISLLYKYFIKEDLEEFLETGKIKKLELIKDKTVDEIEECFRNKHNEAVLAQIDELKKRLK
ncbi:MAG: hypothetical protein A3F91_09840 [Flavobacteria bacterium RIFCSPLOWO2_12_FULL_35_11]|nr:MAG: hypothetical protein A3F91_09840 [Flavobacteria bacterium RIFCSPLOWO2_12_FULL_35_11]